MNFIPGDNYHYALGHFLHPHFRGYLLKKSGLYENVKTKLIEDHPTTIEFLEKQQEKERNKDTQATTLVEDDDELDIFTMDDFNPNQSGDKNTSQCMPDIERELTVFLAMPPINEGGNVDVLGWWKNQQVNLPLLAQLARDVYCIPAASASSERVFSASGGIVTDKRHNLATETCKKLTLTKVNYDFVKKYMTIRLVTPEEQMALDWSSIQTPQTTPSTLTQTMTPSTSKTQTKLGFKKVDKVNKHKLICLSSSSSSSSTEQSPPQRTLCLPPGAILNEGKGKGKGKNSTTPSQKRQASELDTQELTPIRKRPKNSGLTPEDIRAQMELIESADMFDDDTSDPDYIA